MDRYSDISAEAAASPYPFTRGRSVPLSSGAASYGRGSAVGTAAVAESAGEDSAARTPRRRTNFMKYAADNRAVHTIYEFTTGRYKPLFIALVVLAVLASMYGPVRDYYVAYRTSEVLTKQIALRESYNKSIQSEVDTLLSREGIEDAARTRLGLVMPGESTLTVKGLDGDSSDSDSPSSTTMSADELEKLEADAVNDAPWFIKALDVLFFFNSTTGQAVTSTGASS